MVMLIAAVCIVIATVIGAVQASKIRGGWVPPKFTGRAAEFLLRKRKEYTMLVWLGIIAGPVWIALGVLEWGRPGAYERIGTGVLFMICGAVMFAVRAQLPAQPPAETAPPRP